MNLEKEIRRMARDLLKRHPLRRGPYLITDAQLRAWLRRKPRA